jgi:electron transfer flavoprotein beta subunit
MHPDPFGESGLKTVEPPKRQAGLKVTSVEDLVGKLKNEAGVLS